MGHMAHASPGGWYTSVKMSMFLPHGQSNTAERGQVRIVTRKKHCHLVQWLRRHGGVAKKKIGAVYCCWALPALFEFGIATWLSLFVFASYFLPSYMHLVWPLRICIYVFNQLHWTCGCTAAWMMPATFSSTVSGPLHLPHIHHMYLKHLPTCHWPHQMCQPDSNCDTTWSLEIRSDKRCPSASVHLLV